ncbi:Extradiol ring-cleavage dioxygenase, class III enzyme, subunit B [Halteromyces radiatus]|uniref:Extradiol ring-cleavage dioxygenase, class III enzyme, subunit B n=1 Tax=Halteromyces radiatus TaxID=101107 RepID=UPI00221E60B5|nr:Extradiol ring-cleavage dioxygenase, class III enzyme, subunit B [Halteromyces radiatus]KAI8097340.1 Extradiol ring-cleavage dioxygenase, class III enzyme, subunit B [Halteromyces radiatus]
MAITRQPVFFISHGGPNLLENKEKPGEFYTWFGSLLKKDLKPKAIVIISAHYQGTGKNGIFVDTSEKPTLIYDFYGFPKRYYEETWDHSGEPAVASKVIDLLQKANIKAQGKQYGNDHGVWVPLKRAMKSNPDIPIVEVSTFEHEDMALHIKMGQALAPLRDEGVVIIGSGSAVHNLRDLWTSMGKPSPKYVIDFDKDMEKIAVESIGDQREKQATQLNTHPAFRPSHPTAEHLMPFHVAVGAAGVDQGIKLLEDYTGTLAWGSYAFGLPSTYTNNIPHRSSSSSPKSEL